MKTDSFLGTIFWSFIGYVITWLYLLFPESSTLYRCYPFNKQEITKQAYIEYASWRVFMCILFYQLWILSIKYAPVHAHAFKIIFYLWIGFFIDYILFYNQPVTKLKGLPISYALIMGLVFFFTMIFSFFK